MFSIQVPFNWQLRELNAQFGLPEFPYFEVYLTFLLLDPHSLDSHLEACRKAAEYFAVASWPTRLVCLEGVPHCYDPDQVEPIILQFLLQHKLP